MCLSMSISGAKQAAKNAEETPFIEVLGVVELSLDDLGEYERPSPPSDPICDLSAVVAEVALDAQR